MTTSPHELDGAKRRTSVLVRGYSALEIAKQLGPLNGGVPGNYTEAEFIEWLRGEVGPHPTVLADAVAGSEAAVEAEETLTGVILHFTLPEGPEGDQGPPGELMFSGAVTAGHVAGIGPGGTSVVDLAGVDIAFGFVKLDSAGKLPAGFLPSSIVGAVVYQGTWNANTNFPAMPAADVGNKGNYYVVSGAGTTSIDGINSWEVGDWIISNGVTWNKIDNTDSVISVAGLSGIISAASLRAALALAIADTSGLQAALDAKEGLGLYVAINRKTADYTFALTDKGKLIEANHATNPIVFTVPANATAAFGNNVRIDLARYGAGEVSIAAAGGVSIRSADGNLKLNKRYSAATLVKIDTDEWYLFGDLKP